MINKNQLKEIINNLIQVCDELDLRGVSSSVIFSEACSYHRGILIGESRKINSNDIKDKPTEKQIYALKRLNKYKEGMTKQEAFKIIKESKK